MLTLRPCRGEWQLSDPEFVGAFVDEVAQIAGQEHVTPWCAYVAWDGERPVGFGMFKGPPDAASAVEIGYLTFPAAQGRGVATEVAGKLIAIARSEGTLDIVAHTLPEANASTRVLDKLGFSRDGWGDDAEAGKVWRWRHSTKGNPGDG